MVIKTVINPSYEWREDGKKLGISHRELEVFALLSEGHDNKEIAQILNIQYQSVKNHLYSLSKKLKAINVAQATVILQFKNMIRLEYPTLPENYQKQFTNENMIENMKKQLEENNRNLNKKEKIKLRKFLVDHELYGQMYEDRMKELRESEKDKS
jgi:DNA-binding CsgD family transcriptional regulator